MREPKRFAVESEAVSRLALREDSENRRTLFHLPQVNFEVHLSSGGMMIQSKFLRAILVLPVSDIHTATTWYEQILHFETAFIHEGENEQETANYAILQRDEVSIHLILDEGYSDEHPWTRAGTGYLYLQVSDIDQVYTEMKVSGVEITRDLREENWGARGFNLKDPSGNEIHIEQGE